MFSRFSLVKILSIIFTCSLIAVVAVFLYPSTNGLRVTYFDVGQGDGALIQLPDNLDILVDGGPDRGVVQKVGGKLPFFNQEIELIILTHPHEDHIVGALEAMKRFKVDQVWYTGVKYPSSSYKEFLDLVKAKNILLKIIDHRQTVQLEGFKAGGGAAINIIYPNKSVVEEKNVNDSSIIFQFVYGKKKFLFTGDAGTKIEQSLLDENIDLSDSILKVAHHGSDDASLEAFLLQISPEYAIISLSKNNTFRHPREVILKRLERIGSSILRTDQLGDIVFESDGSNLNLISKFSIF